MDVASQLEALAARVARTRGRVLSEAATKQALVLPFLQALGYDVFDPAEVIPEFTADVGTKKGEKVDLVVVNGGQAALLVECKGSEVVLEQADPSQLYRYFSVTPARFAVLTNGVRYRFYSDLEAPNKLDAEPFLEVDLAAATPATGLGELQRFAKANFDGVELLDVARRLRDLRRVKQLLRAQLHAPDDELVRLLAARLGAGRLAGQAKAQFAEIVRQAFRELVAEQREEDAAGAE